METATVGHSRTPTPFRRELGRRLKARRISLGWTREGMELRSGGRLKASIVRAYESGDRCPPLETFVELAELLGGPMLRLLPVRDSTSRRTQLEDDVLQLFREFASLPKSVPAPRDGEVQA